MKRKVFFLLTVLLLSAGTLNLSAATQSKTTNATTTFLAGALTLNSVPATFDFGSNQITTSPVVATLAAGTYTVSITDLRTTVNGYSVTVSAPKLTSTTSHTLDGSNIQMKNGTAALIGTVNPSIIAPTVSQSFYVDQVDGSGNSIPTKVITAANAPLNGLLQWNVNWTGANVIMTVQPGEAYAEKYNTTITWTLSDTP